MNLSLTDVARADLVGIRHYIAFDSPAAADRTAARILQSLQVLEHFPLLGRAGRVAGTRELVVNGLPYLVIYRLIGATDIEVVSIVHTKQNRAAMFS